MRAATPIGAAEQRIDTEPVTGQWQALSSSSILLAAGTTRHRPFFAFAPLSVIPTQVVKPSVSWATVLQGTALTIFVEPPGPTVAKPVPVNISGNGPSLEYGVAGPGGPYAPV